MGTREGRDGQVGTPVILGIETSVEHVGVALGDHRGLRASTSLSSDRRHAESLAPMISFVLGQAGITTSDLTAIAVDIGPGLFTGMRVGITTAQTMAWALEIPVVPVCSLDLVAMNAVVEGAIDDETPVAAALDARRGEVYWALYRFRKDSIEPMGIRAPEVCAPEETAVILAERAESVSCAGSGFVRHHELFASVPWATCLPASSAHPRAENLVRLAGMKLAREESVEADMVAPMYLRAPDAEIHWNTREARR